MLTNRSGTLCKIFRTITIIFCSVEINLDRFMFKLSNLLLLTYASLKSGKMTVESHYIYRVSCKNLNPWNATEPSVQIYHVMHMLCLNDFSCLEALLFAAKIFTPGS